VLTAIVTREVLEDLDLAERTPCCALVDAAHVLIAVND
jgi:molybdopterin-binding protein